MFRDEIPYNSDKWCLYNGREIYADVDIKTGNAGTPMYFKVKAWQADNFVEVLEKKIKELEKLVDELAKQRKFDEILNADEEPKTLAEALIESIDVVS
ncbi:MAG TPA: hypothetical protein EYP30_04705 [Archaeoglobaceae archaeon]|nr:hypothetical protein [Archaeoglobaceae archaeon]